MSKGILELISEIKRGSAEAFLQLVSRVETLFGDIIRTSKRVWFSSELVLVRNCTYILMDKREGKAYALVPVNDTYMVLNVDLDLTRGKSERELIESICIYIEDIISTKTI